MRKKLQKLIVLVVCVIFLFTFSRFQLVNAQDIEIYKGAQTQKYTAANLEGTRPDISSTSIKAIDLVNGSVKFTSKISSGAKYDILRSDNGSPYTKLTDFPLVNEDFVDKYALSGHTYYYIVVIYDANGAVIGNNGPFKAVIKEGVSTSSKTIVLQLDNQYASVNGEKYTLDVKPFLQDGRTMVPLRFISESLGAQVSWDGNEQKITVTLNGNTITLWIGKSEARINSSTVFMDVPAMISNERTLVPIRFVSESLKLKVDFNDDTKQITITGDQADKQQPVVSAPSTSSIADSALLSIIKSGKTYAGLSASSSTSAKYGISFNSYNEQTGEFKGKIDWVGSNIYDDFSGKLDGEKIVFKQTARHVNGKITPMDASVTMKMGSNNRVVGTWIDAQTGDTGTTWFEIPATAAAPAKFNGSYDSNGFPTGKATLEFGSNSTFVGEVKVAAKNFIAVGVVSYTDGTKVIGRFVNGKPDGLSSIIYPNQKAYLVDFKYGKPVKFYTANTIPVYKENEIEVYKSSGIDIFKADDIEIFKADNIEVFNADSIEPYKAEMIKMYQAQSVEKYESITSIEKYEAEVVKLNPPGTSYTSIPVGGFTSPDYMNPLVQAWTSHMMALPYLINNNMVYR